jgi:alkylation response protein AidB-like acyl-CoA dehydrogenase
MSNPIELIDFLNCALSCWLKPDLDETTLSQVLALADQIGREKLLPSARILDIQSPAIVDGRVVTPVALKASLDALAEAGFFAPNASAERAGIGLPVLVSAATSALFASYDAPTFGYCMLTTGVANLIHSFGTADQQARFLAPLEAGKFFGTMCLSEPHAGSSVGDVRTSARLLPDGRYALRGSKMWISGCEHELSENIIHTVLARVEGAAAGSKGLSLFIVPRFNQDARGAADRSLPNGVELVALNHKMGYRGTVNGALSFGTDRDCMGELLGPLHGGMACMFQMMNEARIAVGIGAAAIGWRGYQIARDYAHERTQGRPLSQPNPQNPPVPIIEHSDVKRMLIKARAQSEAAVVLCLYGAHLVDQPDNQFMQQRLGLLTPIMKSWPSKYALEANDLAIQVLGGAGYTQDWLVEKLYRDNRLNPIHEGTHGIQALDLLLRKLLGDSGHALSLLLLDINVSASKAASWATLNGDGLANICQKIYVKVQQLCAKLPAWAELFQRNPDHVAAQASLVLDALGTCVACWLSADFALATHAHPLHQRLLDNVTYLAQFELPAAFATLDCALATDGFLAGLEVGAI